MFTIARYIDAVAFCLITTCFLAVTSLLIDKKAMGTGLALGIVLIQTLDFSRQEGKGRRGPSKLSFNDLIYLPAVPVCMCHIKTGIIL